MKNDTRFWFLFGQRTVINQKIAKTELKTLETKSRSERRLGNALLEVLYRDQHAIQKEMNQLLKKAHKKTRKLTWKNPLKK